MNTYPNVMIVQEKVTVVVSFLQVSNIGIASISVRFMVQSRATTGDKNAKTAFNVINA
jgi:hypothetical protein